MRSAAAVPATGISPPAALQRAFAVVFRLNIPASSPLHLPALTQEKRGRYLLRHHDECSNAGAVSPVSEEDV